MFSRMRYWDWWTPIKFLLGLVGATSAALAPLVIAASLNNPWLLLIYAPVWCFLILYFLNET